MPRVWFTRCSAKRSQQLFANNGITLGILQLARNNQAKITIHRSVSWQAWHRGWDSNLCPWYGTWCHSKILGQLHSGLWSFQLPGLWCPSLQPGGTWDLVGAEGGAEHLKDAGFWGPAPPVGEFGAVHPWDNCACCNLSSPADGERPVQMPLGKSQIFWVITGPCEGGTHSPFYRMLCLQLADEVTVRPVALVAQGPCQPHQSPAHPASIASQPAPGWDSDKHLLCILNVTLQAGSSSHSQGEKKPSYITSITIYTSETPWELPLQHNLPA